MTPAAGTLGFVNLDPRRAPLGEALEDLASLIGHFDRSTMKPAAPKDWFVDCNWKVYVGNYFEGPHIPIVHPSLNREIDYGQYRTQTRGYYSIQHSPIRESARRLRKDEPAVPTSALPDAEPRSTRPRSGGRESKFLAGALFSP